MTQISSCEEKGQQNVRARMELGKTFSLEAWVEVPLKIRTLILSTLVILLMTFSARSRILSKKYNLQLNSQFRQSNSVTSVVQFKIELARSLRSPKIETPILNF